MYYQQESGMVHGDYRGGGCFPNPGDLISPPQPQAQTVVSQSGYTTDHSAPPSSSVASNNVKNNERWGPSTPYYEHHHQHHHHQQHLHQQHQHQQYQQSSPISVNSQNYGYQHSQQFTNPSNNNSQQHYSEYPVAGGYLDNRVIPGQQIEPPHVYGNVNDMSQHWKSTGNGPRSKQNASNYQSQVKHRTSNSKQAQQSSSTPTGQEAYSGKKRGRPIGSKNRSKASKNSELPQKGYILELSSSSEKSSPTKNHSSELKRPSSPVTSGTEDETTPVAYTTSPRGSSAKRGRGRRKQILPRITTKVLPPPLPSSTSPSTPSPPILEATSPPRQKRKYTKRNSKIQSPQPEQSPQSPSDKQLQSQLELQLQSLQMVPKPKPRKRKRSKLIPQSDPSGTNYFNVAVNTTLSVDAHSNEELTIQSGPSNSGSIIPNGPIHDSVGKNQVKSTVKSNSPIKKKKITGPFIHVNKTKGGSKCTYSVVNTSKKPEEDKEGSKKGSAVQNRNLFGSSQKRDASGNYHPSSSMNVSFAARNKHSVPIPNSDTILKDESWICIFCQQRPHYKGMGDLFGPYYIPVEKDNQANHSLGVNGDIKCEESNEIPDKKSINPLIINNNSSVSSTATNNHEENLIVQREVWFHEDCLVWSNGVFLAGNRIRNIEEVIKDCYENVCCKCLLQGASLGCLHKGCQPRFHFLCAKEKGCEMDEENFSIHCPKHKKKNHEVH